MYVYKEKKKRKNNNITYMQECESAWTGRNGQAGYSPSFI